MKTLQKLLLPALAATLALVAPAVRATEPQAFDPSLAQSLGADDYGMKHYVLVVLKTGPTPMPAGPDRDAMFAGHFANIKRLGDEGKLAVAGPFEGKGSDWRGLFVFATGNLEEAKSWVATDPVIAKGEMIAEFHPLYSSAALMLVPGDHSKVAKKSF
jgi:uncharacterized protein YciI